MKKRGQFYLVAALVIIGLVIGLSAVYNTIKVSQEDKTIYFLYEEVNTESSRFIDQGVYNSLSQQEIETRLVTLIRSYSATSPENDFLTVYGNKTKARVYLYSQNQGSIGIDDGSGAISLIPRIELGPRVYSADITSNHVLVKLGEGESSEVDYSFNLQEGQTFYLLIKKDRSGERFVLVDT